MPRNRCIGIYNWYKMDKELDKRKKAPKCCTTSGLVSPKVANYFRIIILRVLL